MNRLRWVAPLVALLALATTAAAQRSGVVEIEMRTTPEGVRFDPAGVWVEPGTTVRFVLREGVHDTQAYHPDNDTILWRIPNGAEPWRSPLMGGLIARDVRTFDVVLTVEGVYDYFCSPHESYGMVGRIVVGNPDRAPARPLEELPSDAVRAALPSVATILARVTVPWAPPVDEK